MKTTAVAGYGGAQDLVATKSFSITTSFCNLGIQFQSKLFRVQSLYCNVFIIYVRLKGTIFALNTIRALGSVTLEKSKLDLTQKQTKSSPELDIGGGEGGLFRRQIIFEELFDRKFVDALLNEWQRTMMDLPAALRQAYEMGLVSSAQMVKFLAINARPTTNRFISRTLPQALSRSFIGR